MFRISAAAGPFLQGKRVLCGFSGGADSLYLLLALKQLSAPFSFLLEAVHFDHGLRGAESCADAEWCCRKCREEQLPCTVLSLKVEENRRPGEGLEAAARRLRLEQWKRLHAERPGCVIALGHHADDRIENLFLRLFRGSNATGLTSMRFLSRMGSVEFIRPLLELSREEIETALKEAGESWRTDSTNLQAELCRRNVLRLEILPMLRRTFPAVEKGILRSLSAMECDADFLERSAADTYEEMRRTNSFAPSDWRKLHRAELCRVLRLFLREHIGRDVVPDLPLIERFERAILHPPENGERRIVELKEEPVHFLCVEREAVSVGTFSDRLPGLHWNWKEQSRILFGDFELTASRVAFPVFGDPFSAFFSETLPPELCIAVREDGERMVPFGKHTPVPLKKLFSEAGINASARKGYPVLRLPDGSPLWIPGGKRSALFPVGPGACIRICARCRNGSPEKTEEFR